MNAEDLQRIIQNAIKPVVGSAAKEATRRVIVGAKSMLIEGAVLLPKVFSLRTEYLSLLTKEIHMRLYKEYVDSYNKIATKLDTVSRFDQNPNDSEFRRLKLDEQHNLNAVKLHELYFSNISDVKSEIRADSVPYMKLARDWGTFEAWQFDFRACGIAATEGWAVLYYDPFKQRYFNCVVEKHTEGVPLMGIPIIVMDTWHHAWFKDHAGDKVGYLNAMMLELNWEVIQARMIIAETSTIHQIFAIEPMASLSDKRQVQFVVPTNQPPIITNSQTTQTSVAGGV